MEIITSQEGEHTSFAIKGRLDTITAVELEEYAEKLYAQNVKDIDVDMDDCEFVSSAGLRVIVAMQKRANANGSLVFHNVQDNVMEVFQMTGFDKILTIA